MKFSHTRKLEVWRTLSNGSKCLVGLLAQNRQGIYFQYSEEYLSKHHNISPFSLSFNNSLQLADRTIHGGLHGVFSDSLPDSWGMLLMDRVFRKEGILPSQITLMDRLAFIGNNAMGALSFYPESFADIKVSDPHISIADLGCKAQEIFDGRTEEVLAALLNAGSPGGARPKANIYLKNNDHNICSTTYEQNSIPYLVKFTSKNLPLQHEEGLCEAAYLTMAAKAGIDVPKWKLLGSSVASSEMHWLALERFDLNIASNNSVGRYHIHSACGLLDADYRAPSLDYEDLIKASSILCKSPATGQRQFCRAIFNLFACNQDDHSKNWAFIQNDNGKWTLAPFFDVTFNPSPYGEHATAFSGYGKEPPLKTIQKLAEAANFASWKQAQTAIKEIVDAIHNLDGIASGLGVSKETLKLISKQLDNTYKENRKLLS